MMIGFDIGIIIVKKILALEAPSILAASSKAFGRVPYHDLSLLPVKTVPFDAGRRNPRFDLDCSGKFRYGVLCSKGIFRYDPESFG